jgi:hypothetical protein
VAESSSFSIPALAGLAVETVEWLPSGAESGLVRVRGRWVEETARQPDLPVLVLVSGGEEHRFDSLPDARFSRDPATWRGTYLVPAELVVSDPDALWLEWAGGLRSGLPALARGVEPPPVPRAPERVEPPEETGGQVIDRAVLAERRARRAEAAEQQQARVAAEALKAVEVLELRSAELERRLEEATTERDGLAAADRREALEAALASAAALRSRSREWQLHLRTSEVARASDAVRLAVLESGAPTLRSALDASRAEAAARAGELAAATESAAVARAAVSEAESRLAETEARRAEIESQLTTVQSELVAAREQVSAALGDLATLEARLRVETVARTTLEDELDRERAQRQAANTDLRTELDAARAATTDLTGQLDATRAELDAAHTELTSARAATTDLRAELDAARAATTDLAGQLETARSELAAARAATSDLAGQLEAERAARRAAEGAGAGLQERIAELERHAASGREELERVAREQAAAAAAQAPAPDSAQIAANLDAAAESLRRRVEPVAPDAEPAVEWSEQANGDARPPVVPGAAPPREGPDSPDAEWAPAEFVRVENLEPPAPDAEPFVEAAPPSEPAHRDEVVSPPAEEVVSTPPPVVSPEPAIAGPTIVPASGPPPRALMIGTEKRDYPLLRGAIVKLAHDDAALAARVLAALLPAQGACIQGPLAYDLTIAGLGTFGIGIAGGRATVEPLERPRPRHDAEFHLSADPLILAELLAGIEHRIGRFFGPARVKGRKRRVKALHPLHEDTASLTEAARAGATLDPELVYRTFAYAVHPSWTRGHTFTIAQQIVGDPPETWYLTARNGAGLTVSSTPPAQPPSATVSMTRATFDRLLRAEPLPSGTRPAIRGDRHAVDLMRSWTDRAR